MKMVVRIWVMNLKRTINNTNAMFAMRSLTIMHVQFVVYERVHLAMLLDIDAIVPKINVDLVGNLLVYPDLILLTTIGTTKANAYWKV